MKICLMGHFFQLLFHLYNSFFVDLTEKNNKIKNRISMQKNIKLSHQIFGYVIRKYIAAINTKIIKIDITKIFIFNIDL